MMGGSVPILTEAVIEQISHLSPTELSALLVRGAAPVSPDADVHFCATSGCFGRAPRGRMFVHCLHWSARCGASPPSRVPLVGDPLRADRAGADGAFLRVSGAGADTLLAPRARGSSVGVLRLTRGGSGVYGRATRRAHALWDFFSQIPLADGAAGLSDALTVELFSRKMIAWIFACFARLQVAPSRQLSLRQLEMAFPLLLALDAPQRAALVGGAVARLAGGLLSFYDGRVIARRGAPVSAAALLAPAELAAVTAVEQASASFVFRCQMRHEAALGALQAVADAWAKRREASPSAHICAAVAALLAHAAGTCALLVPQRGIAAARAVVARHIPAIFATGAVSAAARAVALLRGGNVARHRAALRALLAEAEALEGPPVGAVGLSGEAVGLSGGAVGLSGGAVGLSGGTEGSGGGTEGALPDAACGFFESVSPALHGAGVAWRVSAGGRHTPMPPPPHGAAPQSTPPTPGAQLLEAVLCGLPRIGFARPMLRVSELGMPALRLNMCPGEALEMTTSSEEDVWHAPRKRRRGADRAED